MKTLHTYSCSATANQPTIILGLFSYFLILLVAGGVVCCLHGNLKFVKQKYFRIFRLNNNGE
jgi:hypothetical protein